MCYFVWTENKTFHKTQKPVENKIFEIITFVASLPKYITLMSQNKYWQWLNDENYTTQHYSF